MNSTQHLTITYIPKAEPGQLAEGLAAAARASSLDAVGTTYSPELLRQAARALIQVLIIGEGLNGAITAACAVNMIASQIGDATEATDGD